MILVHSQVWELVVCSLFWYKSQLTAFYLVLNCAAHIICRATFSLIPQLVTLFKSNRTSDQWQPRSVIFSVKWRYSLENTKLTSIWCILNTLFFVCIWYICLYILKLLSLWPKASLLSGWNYYSEVRIKKRVNNNTETVWNCQYNISSSGISHIKRWSLLKWHLLVSCHEVTTLSAFYTF